MAKYFAPMYVTRLTSVRTHSDPDPAPLDSFKSSVDKIKLSLACSIDIVAIETSNP